MTATVIRGHPGIGPPVTGTALVAQDNFSARYDLDLTAGCFSRPAHALYGERYVASAWMLRAMAESGLSPLALLLNFANPIMAQGAAFAALPLIDRFEDDITLVLRSGDEVQVDPTSGSVTVLRRST